MMAKRPLLCLLALLIGLPDLDAATESVWLHALDLTTTLPRWVKPQANRSLGKKPLSIGGTAYACGVGTRTPSTWWIDLGGAERFVATVGVDDAANERTAVNFMILGDGKLLWESGPMQQGDRAKSAEVPLAGARRLLLQVTGVGTGAEVEHAGYYFAGYADWADARILFTGTRPKAMGRPLPPETAAILTPKPGPAPRINGPKVYGCRPNHPFLYRVPTQGERPMTFTADDLPASLQLDAATGIITGMAPARGAYEVTLRARNDHGESTRNFRIVSGDTLSLTPAMGWNHWYTHYTHITDAKMREAVDILVRSGMADVGYSYVNLDDCWMNAPRSNDPRQVGPLRDGHGNIVPNAYFPDMKALTEYIHRQGLKAGIYSSPGPLTCGEFAGSYQHEAQDAQQYAAWGFDFLKYDWCRYEQIARQTSGSPRDIQRQPFALMGGLLRQQRRDILFNLCQYGRENVWEWGAAVGAQSWRTSIDLGLELDRVFEVALANADHRAWSGPGAWNDPDYVQIGFLGDNQAYTQRAESKSIPVPLTPTEQYSFMSLWSLIAAPIFFGGDLTRLDEFSISVLCNPEVIDIDQDALGQCARVVRVDRNRFLLVKDLADGTKAVGLCNAGELPAEIVAPWRDLGVTGKCRVRDVWRQQDLGVFESAYQAPVPRRGVVLVRLQPGDAPALADADLSHGGRSTARSPRFQHNP